MFLISGMKVLFQNKMKMWLEKVILADQVWIKRVIFSWSDNRIKRDRDGGDEIGSFIMMMKFQMEIWGLQTRSIFLKMGIKKNSWSPITSMIFHYELVVSSPDYPWERSPLLSQDIPSVSLMQRVYCTANFNKSNSLTRFEVELFLFVWITWTENFGDHAA